MSRGHTHLFASTQTLEVASSGQSGQNYACNFIIVRVLHQQVGIAFDPSLRQPNHFCLAAGFGDELCGGLTCLMASDHGVNIEMAGLFSCRKSLLIFEQLVIYR